MYIPIVCRCGRCIADIYPAFKLASMKYFQKELAGTAIPPGNMLFNTDAKLKLGPILDEFHLHLDCCRMTILFAAEFKDFY